MHQLGIYVWPTTELCDFFEKELKNKQEILEICAGNGVLAEKLNWNATDNYSQSPKFKPKNDIENI